MACILRWHMSSAVPPGKRGWRPWLTWRRVVGSGEQEAQNAVSALALYTLLPDQPLYRVLPQPYRDMWISWHDKGQATQKEAVAEEDARRSAFISSLVAGGAAPPVPPPSEQAEAAEAANAAQRGASSSSTAAAGARGSAAAATAPEDDGNAANASSQAAAAAAAEVERARAATGARADTESRRLLREREAKSRSSAYREMLAAREKLPMAKSREQLLAALRSHSAVVVSGETGSGKTTQVPQYVLDEMIAAGKGALCNIVCTQPRRIAAVSVAERVAAERCEPPPGSAGSLVGYHVRLDASRSASTRLLFCTTGILLRRLAGDRELAGVSHVVVDEVHERTLQGDFLLVILKELVQKREALGLPPLKLILMSATLDATLFASYFGGCPVVAAEGRTHPVETHYLEDIYETLDYRLASDAQAAVRSGGDRSSKHSKIKSTRSLAGNSRGRQDLVRTGFGDEAQLAEAAANPYYDAELYAAYSASTRKSLLRVNEDVIDYELAEDLVAFIDEHHEAGAILVFLPGIGEIQALHDRLAASRRFGGAALQWLIPLHSTVAPADQKRAFQRPPPGVRKVVLATNIAETSITIDDVVFVVDTGKLKENRFDPRRGMSSLEEAWISKANARQRAGRAGRVKPGHCFALYTRHRHETLMHPYQLPEILRVPLVELCLQIKLLDLGAPASFLNKAIEPPKEEAVKSAMATLFEVGAVDESQKLTALGCHLAALPVDVRIGKVMLYGAVLGCLAPALTIAACLSYKSPFSAPHDQKEAASRAKQALVAPVGEDAEFRTLASGQQSDHLAMAAAYSSWQTALQKGGSKGARDLCKKYFLSWQTLDMLKDMRQQFARLLADIGFVAPPQGDAKWRGEWADDPQQVWNKSAGQAAVIKAVLCAGLYPNVAAMEEESIQGGHATGLGGSRAGLSGGGRPRWTDGRVEVAVHPSSVNHALSEFKRPFLVFHEKVKTSKVFIRDCTVVTPQALLLFGGPITVHHQTGRVTVDGWLEMHAPAQTGVLFKELRRALEKLLGDKIGRPQQAEAAASKADDVVSTLVQLLVDEEKPAR